jgi:hypothetical protein
VPETVDGYEVVPNEDPAQAKSCIRLRRWSKWIFYFSAADYAIGFFFAFF